MKEAFIPPEIRSLKSKLNAWRQTRVGGVIPAELWQEAITLSKTFGCWRVGKALGLNGTDLKKRRAKFETQKIQVTETLLPQRQSFIEMLPAFLETPKSSTAGISLQVCGLTLSWNQSPESQDWKTLFSGLILAQQELGGTSR